MSVVSDSLPPPVAARLIAELIRILPSALGRREEALAAAQEAVNIRRDLSRARPEAINAVFPETTVQTCIMHLIRNSMDFASWKDRKAIAAVLKTVYRAKDADAGRQALDEFDAGPWGKKYPAIAQSWRRHWEQVIRGDGQNYHALRVCRRVLLQTTSGLPGKPMNAAATSGRGRADLSLINSFRRKHRG